VVCDENLNKQHLPHDYVVALRKLMDHPPSAD
jgi:hypothetical protein